MEKQKLELKEESWKNLFECIRDSKINAKDNFWASIQYLEEQLEREIKEVGIPPQA